MIIINKKKVKIVLACVLISIFAFSFKIANNKKELDKNVIETTATPVSGKTIIIDARTWSSR